MVIKKLIFKNQLSFHEVFNKSYQIMTKILTNRYMYLFES